MLKDLKEREYKTPRTFAIDEPFRVVIPWLQLRQEAIRRIKEKQKIKYNQRGYAEGRIIIKWIKHFFDLTEKDLNEKN